MLRTHVARAHRAIAGARTVASSSLAAAHSCVAAPARTRSSVVVAPSSRVPPRCFLPVPRSVRSLHSGRALSSSSSKDPSESGPGEGEGDEDESLVPPEEDDDDTATTSADDGAEGKEEDMNAMLEGRSGGGGGGYAGAGGADVDEDADDLVDDPRQNLRPSELVAHLDKFIVGQFAAKKSVAVALRNRWRRHSVRPAMRNDITPKNILMVGPTGCGKTEIARRLALITDSPFLKVEATKFTEVGFYGKDVDTIIRDLLRVAINNLKAKKRAKLQKSAGKQVEQALLEAFQESRTREEALGKTPTTGIGAGQRRPAAASPSARPTAEQTALDLEALRKGELDARLIDIDVPLPKSQNPLGDLMGGSERGGGRGGNGGGDDDDAGPRGAGLGFTFQALSGMKSSAGGSGAAPGMERRYGISIGEARPLLMEHYISSRIRTRDLAKKAIKQVESDGIVFLDEIDKICTSSAARRFSSSADASAEGVQRDLLPLVEGTTISTPHGPVNTDHILFICSGAFHQVRVSDMLPELQGRLPIRVELKALTEDDFYRILTVPTNNLIRQQVALLNTDHVTLRFTDAAIREIARVSFEANRTLENIGARRLNTVIQRIMDEYSFTAADQPEGTHIEIGVDYVREKIKPLLKNTDLSKYVL